MHLSRIGRSARSLPLSLHRRPYPGGTHHHTDHAHVAGGNTPSARGRQLSLYPLNPLCEPAYACPVAWPSSHRIPVFGANNVVIDYLYSSSGTQYFRCESYGARYTYGSSWNTWYAYTQGDNGKWGWVSEVFFKGGNNNEPDADFPYC